MDFNYMTKYERVILIAQRAQDIANGSPITIKSPETNDPIEIAKLELKYGRIPYKIVRKSPSGEKKVLKPSEMLSFQLLKFIERLL